MAVATDFPLLSPLLLDAGDPSYIHSLSSLRMQLKALTWASQAKDAALTSLNTKIRSVLDSAKTDQDKLAEICCRNQRLELELKESCSREHDLKTQLLETRRRLEDLEFAEERLASQLGDFEAESLEETRLHNTVVSSLGARLQDVETQLATAQAELNDLRSKKQQSSNEVLERELAEVKMSLGAAQLDLSKSERQVESLQREVESSEASRKEQEALIKKLQRKGEDEEMTKSDSFKVKAAGMRFNFSYPRAYVVRCKAIIT